MILKLLKDVLMEEKGVGVFRFETEHNAGQMVFVYSDDSLMKALRAMWKYRISGVPILDRSSKSLLGNIRYCDVRILLDKPHVFMRRKLVFLLLVYPHTCLFVSRFLLATHFDNHFC